MYESSLSTFMRLSQGDILRNVVISYHGVVQDTQNEAWDEEIAILKEALAPWQTEHAHIVLEYDIPRLGKRIDVVLLLRGLIFCLEFKINKREAMQQDVEQVMDYALDLTNFHELSQGHKIVPILVPTEVKDYSTRLLPLEYSELIYNPLITGKAHLKETIQRVLDKEQAQEVAPEVDLSRWIISPYKPTPTIVEAARCLYEHHTVEDITRHEADKVSTDATTNYILKVIEESKVYGQKSICFVTGVPGAGKTLVGLDVAVKQTYKDGGQANEEEGAVYLSGNGPLVAVLTEALARDNWAKCRMRGEKKNISDSRREVGKFIQIIHRYRDNMLAKVKNPIENGVLEIDPHRAIRQRNAGYGEVEHVAIFDEAQRTWTHEHLAQWLKTGGSYGNKTRIANFPMSEAEFLIWSLDQREDWAVIICLVGGGQEINTGEAGISEWIRALNESFTHWHVYISPKLTAPEYAEGKVSQMLQDRQNVVYSDCLHLAVNLRSFRAESLSAFVHHVLAIERDEARQLYAQIKRQGYPVLLTRDIAAARQWLRQHSVGSQRTGIIASSAAARLRPLAVDIRVSPDAVHWFLEDKDDTRSSCYLEDVATEFDVQGLELDYVCLMWDADFRYEGGHWSYYRFNGSTKWNPVKVEERKKYMLNAYRVLLTRARQGMVICVPEGNGRLTAEHFPEDATRLPQFYDGTYEYLKSLGMDDL